MRLVHTSVHSVKVVHKEEILREELLHIFLCHEIEYVLLQEIHIELHLFRSDRICCQTHRRIEVYPGSVEQIFINILIDDIRSVLFLYGLYLSVDSLVVLRELEQKVVAHRGRRKRSLLVAGCRCRHQQKSRCINQYILHLHHIHLVYSCRSCRILDQLIILQHH